MSYIMLAYFLELFKQQEEGRARPETKDGEASRTGKEDEEDKEDYTKGTEYKKRTLFLRKD